MAGGAAAGAAAGAAIGAAVGATIGENAGTGAPRTPLVAWSVDAWRLFMHREFRARGKQPRPPARTRLSPLQPDRTAF